MNSKKNILLRLALAGALAPALLTLPSHAQENDASRGKKAHVFYGLSFEQFENRFGDDSDQLAWDGDAFIGTDNIKLRIQSEGEYDKQENVFEVLENQLLVQWPISNFFDAKAGVRFDTPEGENRTYAMLGVRGLAPQWFEVDADLFVGEKGDASARLDVDYKILITNRVILTPTVEINVAFSDDEDVGVGAGLSNVELGLRLSYDLIDRSVAPYIGVNYGKKFGKTADFAGQQGIDDEEVTIVAGIRLLF